jgi:hypothetical protein
VIHNALRTKAVKAFFYPEHLDFRNAFKKVPRLRSFVLSVTTTFHVNMSMEHWCSNLDRGKLSLNMKIYLSYV